MAALLDLPATADEAAARMEAPVPDDSSFGNEVLENYLTGGSLGCRLSWSVFHDLEKMEPAELRFSKQAAWRHLQLQMCKLVFLDHMDDRLALVRALQEDPDPELEAHYRDLFRKQIADAKTEFLLHVMASITTGPLPEPRQG